MFVLHVRPSQNATVYDLAVEHNPEYYANGVLVHNSFRNGVVAFKEIETTMPQSFWVAERMAAIQEQQQVQLGTQITDINRLIQMQTAQAALYGQQNPAKGGSIILPRNNSQRHRVN